jgi:hypothetical protein
MSLKAFHIFFIALAVLLCLGFGAWCLQRPGYVAIGIASFAFAVGLVCFEIVFLRKFNVR